MHSHRPDVRSFEKNPVVPPRISNTSRPPAEVSIYMPQNMPQRQDVLLQAIERAGIGWAELNVDGYFLAANAEYLSMLANMLF